MTQLERHAERRKPRRIQITIQIDATFGSQHQQDVATGALHAAMLAVKAHAEAAHAETVFHSTRLGVER